MRKHLALSLLTVILAFLFVQQSESFGFTPNSQTPSLWQNKLFVFGSYKSKYRPRLYYKTTNNNDDHEANRQQKSKSRSLLRWLSRKSKKFVSILSCSKNNTDENNDKTPSSKTKTWSLKPEPYWKYKIRDSRLKSTTKNTLQARRQSFLNKRMKYGDFIPPNHTSTYGSELLYAQPEEKPVVIRRKLLEQFWTRQGTSIDKTPTDYYTESGAFE